MKSFWKFLRSLKLTIVLLILLAVFSAIGTLVPQGRSPEEYAQRFGPAYQIFKILQLDRAYKSSWFLGLLMLFSLNMIACTLSRLPAKWRHVTRPNVKSSPDRLKVFKIKTTFEKNVPPAEAAETASRLLARRRRFRVFAEKSERNISLLGLRRSSGWFGSDIVHFGMLVILAGGITSSLGSQDTILPLFEGGQMRPEGAAFMVRLDKFETEYYEEGMIKDWKSTLTIIDNGLQVRTGTIEVNRPMKYKGYNLYQSGYGLNWEETALEIEIRKNEEPDFSRSVFVKPGQVVNLQEAGLDSVAVRSFVPDFIIVEGGRVMSRSDEPHNPAAYIEILNGGERLFYGWVFSNHPGFKAGPGAENSPVSVFLKKPRAFPYSVIEARRDPGTLLIWIGSFILSAGLVFAFYLRPAEIRMVFEPLAEGTLISAGGSVRGGAEAFRTLFEDLIREMRSA